MHRDLKLVYRYRQLSGKCDTGAGLDFDEIGDLTAIEAAFAGEAQRRPGDRRVGERDFTRVPVKLAAVLHRRQFRDAITILDIGPGGFVCEGAPHLEASELVEIIIDASEDSSISYRFMAEVAWTQDRAEDCVVGFKFVGVPVQLRRGPLRPGDSATKPPAASPPAFAPGQTAFAAA